MSEVLAMAVRRAKIARKTPYVINVIDQSDEKLAAANARIEELQKLVTELKGRLGGVMTSLNQKMQNPTYPVETTVFLKISQIADAVSREFKIAVIDLQSERRTKEATVPRQVAMYLCRKLSNRSYPAIAAFFGNRDHTTAMHAFVKVGERRIEDLYLDAKIERLEQFLLAFAAARNNPKDTSSTMSNNINSTE